MPKIKIIQGLRLLPRHRDYSAHSFAQQRMRRTSQLVGLDFSTGRSISPLPVNGQCRKGSIDFHDVSRASTDARIELAQREFTSACSRSSSCQLGKLAFNRSRLTILTGA
ncbi:MAG TPA: hypothetical protein VFF31_00970 [Blastocatellia bacterium]|nr:hypothetical protein [Blastocatellia bacterium]